VFTYITSTNAETAVQFGTAVHWWQRCHTGKISIATRTENVIIARIVTLSKQGSSAMAEKPREACFVFD